MTQDQWKDIVVETVKKINEAGAIGLVIVGITREQAHTFADLPILDPKTPKEEGLAALAALEKNILDAATGIIQMNSKERIKDYLYLNEMENKPVEESVQAE